MSKNPYENVVSNEEQKAILKRLENETVSFEDAKKLIIKGGGYPDRVLQNIGNITGVKVNELVELIINAGGGGYVIGKWNELAGMKMDKELTKKALMKNRSMPFDKESLQTISYPGSIGELLNYCAENGESGDYFRSIAHLKENKSLNDVAEDGTLNEKVAQKFLDKGYYDILKVSMAKFTKAAQVLIKEKAI